MTKRYLVTGAAGFIGFAVAKRLIALGHRVTTIDNLSTASHDPERLGIHFIKGNCQDLDVIQSLRSFSFDAIIHIAGQSSGEVSFDHPIYDLQTNTQSTLLLLNLAREIGCKKFIYASSMSVYGEQPFLPVTETMMPKPASFYAVGKLASEHYMRIYQQFGIQSTALRLFSVYGPGQNMENLRQGMASIFLAMAMKDGHIQVKGSLDRFRDFVYIDDVVSAFLLNLDRPTMDFRIYNVCTGIQTTVKSLIQTIQSLLATSLQIDFCGETPGDLFGISGDYTQIQTELGWKPVCLLSEGLNKMISWAKGDPKIF